MKYLALDIGEKRIGVARSDDSGIIATPIGIIEVDEDVMKNLSSIIKEENIECIVFGIPKHQNGSENKFAADIRKMAEIIKNEFSVNVDFEDEYGSTKIAEERLRKAGKSPREIKKYDDAFAAEVILESYLARQKWLGKIKI